MLIRLVAATSLFTVLAAPAAARSYTATLAAPVAQRIIARDISWECGPDACQGSTVESRPLVLCESLASRAGKVASFLVDGRALSEAELTTCNGFARSPGRNKAVAAE
jgi:hypothetical protein